MQEVKKKYRSIINLLEKSYSQNVGQERMIEVFKASLSKEFKLQLTADSLMEDVLREYHQKCSSDFLGTQAYCGKLGFIEKVNNMLYGIAFISRREYLRMNDTITKERASPVNQWLENISYLRSSDSQSEFRYQFLNLYCGLKEEEIVELVEADSEGMVRLRAHYEGFFQRCLTDVSQTSVVNFIEDSFNRFENKSEMLSPKLIRALDRKLGVEVGGSEVEIDLNKVLNEIAQENAYANDPEAQQRLEDEVKLIEKALQKFSGLNIIKTKGLQLRLGKFGSLTSGFAGTDADLDLTILTNCYVNEVQFLKLLHEFLKKEYKQGERNGTRRVGVEIIATAKTPLIQLSVGERGRIDLKIDLIVNNILGVINSKFLHVYSQIKWIKNLGLLVKLWGKSKGLINKNMLSSYSMVLMLIHYLIKTRRAKAILDHRVTTDKAFFEFKRMKLADVEKFKVYYEFREDPREVSVEERVNYYKQLTGFMHYYAEEFWQEDEKYRIITVDQSIDRPVDPECALTIKDPFDEPHNPGRLKADNRDFLVQKFKEAYELLRSAKEDKVRSLFI